MSRYISLIVALAFAVPSSAFAQAVSDEGFATTGGDELDNEACEGEACWGRKRKVRVVQVRPFTKDGRIELGVLGGIIPNDPFNFYGSTGIRLSYFLSESLAIGGAVVLPFSSDTGLGAELMAKETYRNIDSRRVLEQKLFYHVNILEWSPLVGKMTFYSAGTIHFDLVLSAGFGLLETESPSTRLGESEIEGSRIDDRKFLFATGGGLRFFAADWLAVRFDVGQYFFPKPDELGGLSHPTMVSLGVSTFFPSSGGGR